VKIQIIGGKVIRLGDVNKLLKTKSQKKYQAMFCFYTSSKLSRP
jgi:hypothetical protein